MNSPSVIRILLVEDSPTDVLLTHEALSSSRFQIQACERLTDALKDLSAGAFDVVLLDLGLPDSQGLETLRTLRGQNPQVPVVVLTGKDDEELAAQALQHGAQDYLVKGQVEHDVLGRAIRYAIERNQFRFALREASDFNRQIIGSAQEGIIVLDHDLRCSVWNAYMEALSGLKSVDVVGKHPWHVQPMFTETASRPALEAALAGETVALPDLFVPASPPGRAAWVWQQFSPLHDSLGQIVGVIGTVREITKRKQAEQVLHEQSQLALLSADVGRAFTGSGTLRDMLKRCVKSMVGNLGAAFARIWTLNRTEDVLELQASAGMYTHIDGPHGRVPVGKYKIGLIAEDKQPHLTNDVAHDPRIGDPEWARREGMVAFAGYPLVVENHLVGVMAMFARQNLTDTTLRAMAAVAHQIALGIERKMQEEALRESEERFRELTKHIYQVLWIIDSQESRVTYVSSAYEKMWGRSCQSLMDNPRSYMEGIHPLDLKMMNRENAVMYQTGSIDVETRIVRPDGSVRWVWIRGYPVVEQGRMVRVVGVIEDITEKQQLASERNVLLARLQLHIERMPLAYVLFDRDLVITDWNPAAERILGYSKAEVVGKKPFDLIPPSFKQTGEEILNRIRSGDMAAHSVNENLTKDGRKIVCEWFNTPLMAEDGGFAGLLCLAQDVTERKSLEQQLQQSQKMEAFGQLAGGVAHDFNNLLTVIMGYSELLMAKMPNDPKRSLLADIHHAGERAAGLTRQLLAFSRKQVLEPKVCNLNDIVGNIEKMLRRLIGEDIIMTCILNPKISQVMVDVGQIEQVVMNLAVNARDAMPQGGRLTIETNDVEWDEEFCRVHPECKPGRYAMLVVSDNGCGMTPEVKARIFEPFFTTKGIGKGTGLGLATVFGIIKQSEGQVDVYSEVGVGTSFKIYLPAIEKKASRPEGDSNGGPPPGTETILLVEDEKDVRKIAQMILEDQGYKVLVASGGAEALRIAQAHPTPIHLVVTDVVMPEMSGRELTDALSKRHPNLPVVYMSGYTDDAVVRHGIIQAEVAFLQKPFSPSALAKKVREVLDEKK